MKKSEIVLQFSSETQEGSVVDPGKFPASSQRPIRAQSVKVKLTHVDVSQTGNVTRTNREAEEETSFRPSLSSFLLHGNSPLMLRSDQSEHSSVRVKV